MSLKKLTLSALAALVLASLAPATAFAKPRTHNPILDRVCTDTSWCLQNKDCYETEHNRRALADWYVDNC